MEYDREALVQTLIYHQQTNTSGCHCGWAELGKSWAEHVTNIYEEVLKETKEFEPCNATKPSGWGRATHCLFKKHDGPHSWDINV